jgi:hypothetical protein
MNEKEGIAFENELLKILINANSMYLQSFNDFIKL